MSNVNDFDNTFETYEDFEKRIHLAGYYGEFSTKVRDKLLSKNIPKVSNVYDVLYVKTRETMLSSNVPNITGSIDSISESVRLTELQRNVENDLNFDKINEQARIQNQNRNSLTNTVSNLETIGDAQRESLISKNTFSFPTIDTYAQNALQSELNANSQAKTNIDTYAGTALSNEQNSNNPISVNIDTYAQTALSNEQNSNNPIPVNIDTYAGTALSNEKNSNNPISVNIDTYAQTALSNEQNSNNPISVNIDTYAGTALSNEKNSNNPISVNIDTYAGTERTSELNSNNPIPVNIDAYAGTALSNEQNSNNPISVNIDTYAGTALSNEQNSNNPISVNIDTYAGTALMTEENSNNPISVNIDTYAPGALTAEENANVPISIDIDTYAPGALTSELASNTPAQTDIDTWAAGALTSELASNTPAQTDIDTYAPGALTSELASNTPAQTDIDTWAAGARTNELASNTPAQTDIDTYAPGALTSELASNTPAQTDIDTWAAGALTSELASNTPAQTDIDTYAPGALTSELASNTPAQTDIDTWAAGALTSELASNTPAQTDIDTYATNQLNNELSTNVPSQTSIDLFVDYFGGLSTVDSARDSMLSKNGDFALGVDVAIGGTSFFLGVSNLLIQGAIASNVMTISNKYNLLGHQYSGATGIPKAANLNYGLNSLDNATAYYIKNYSILSDQVERRIEQTLLGNYGVAQPNNTSELIYTVQNKDGTGNYILGNAMVAEEGSLTAAIRAYNIARNYYSVNSNVDIVAAQQNLMAVLNNIRNTQPAGKYSQYSHPEQGTGLFYAYQNSGLGQGAQNKPNEQTNTNTSAPEVSSYLGGNNFNVDASSVLKPLTYSAGTAGSMMAQTNPSEILSNNFLKGESAPTNDSFGTTTRGVRNIIDIISQSSIPLSQNYQRSQNEFYVGIDPSTKNPRLTYQRYTYQNPYSSQGAYQQKLDFSFTNYASGKKMYFPPYIKSYRHDASANWNSHEFLGRPEPVYTYNNGNRTGSISFIVLTDYAETFNYGSVDSSGNITAPYTINYNFTSDQSGQLKIIQAAILSEKNNISDLNTQISSLAGNSIAIADFQTQIANAQKNIASYEQVEKNYNNGNSNQNLYHEFGAGTDYSKSIDASQTSLWDYVNTKTYLDNMKKSLMFVPGYFSGSKVDFEAKMDFLQKLTRPARNAGGTGFMFTTPPVCHLKLGDWFDWDVIIENVSFDYSDSTWTLDDNYNGRVQPMFATVDVTFKIIGAYGGGGKPVLATDKHGFFDYRIQDSSSAASIKVVQPNNQTATLETPHTRTGFGRTVD